VEHLDQLVLLVAMVPTVTMDSPASPVIVARKRPAVPSRAAVVKNNALARPRLVTLVPKDQTAQPDQLAMLVAPAPMDNQAVQAKPAQLGQQEQRVNQAHEEHQAMLERSMLVVAEIPAQPEQTESPAHLVRLVNQAVLAKMVAPVPLVLQEMPVQRAVQAKLVVPALQAIQAEMAHPAVANVARQLVWLQVSKHPNNEQDNGLCEKTIRTTPVSQSSTAYFLCVIVSYTLPQSHKYR